MDNLHFIDYVQSFVFTMGIFYLVYQVGGLKNEKELREIRNEIAKNNQKS